ncbi:hypothetical protein [Phyllobacterium calauticae]|jgi:hypothetical protein|uniref:hypothetical protein n=1 Tax=Phyllobacterium calauticae TaxID=2817027 RepID=UPI001CBB6B75|nr:hypothetical protein [Phyllobacterium calauticae]MBZ3695542.1 hypothetical protein [Phyllobacterium calauticae]
MLTALKYWQIGAGAVLGALIASTPVYLYGKHEGRQQAAVSALESPVQVLRKRNEINETVSSSGAAALCGDFGLSVDDKAKCVRRLLEANSKP